MQDHVIIAGSSGPATMLRHFYGDNCVLEEKFDLLYKSLKTKYGFTKLTKFFLENMLCEMKRIGGPNAKTKDCFLTDTYINLVRTLRTTKNPDLYFEDLSLGKFQHLFRINGKQLEMRQSDRRNCPGHSPINKVNFRYMPDGQFAVDLFGCKLSHCFVGTEQDK